MEGKLPREVIHATGMHQTQCISNGLRTEDSLARDWTEATVSQCGGHHAGGLARHFNGAQLQERTKLN